MIISCCVDFFKCKSRKLQGLSVFPYHVYIVQIFTVLVFNRSSVNSQVASKKCAPPVNFLCFVSKKCCRRLATLPKVSMHFTTEECSGIFYGNPYSPATTQDIMYKGLPFLKVECAHYCGIFYFQTFLQSFSDISTHFVQHFHARNAHPEKLTDVPIGGFHLSPCSGDNSKISAEQKGKIVFDHDQRL